MNEEQRRTLWAEALGLPPDELMDRDGERAPYRRPKPVHRPSPTTGHSPVPPAR